MEEHQSPVPLERLVILIASTGAEVVLIGGVAAILLGSAHQTQDVDFAFRRTKETLRKIARALAPFNPRPIGFPPELPFVWDDMALGNMSTITLTTDLGRIDFLSEPDGVDSVEGLLRRSIDTDLDGTVVRVSSLEDLISMKRAAGRPKDLLHLAELETLKKIQAEEEAQ